MNTNIDYYEILEVHPRASKEVIKKAYQTLAKKYHPDTTSLDKNEALKKMRGPRPGFTPWNKGKKGLQKAWNKGLKTKQVVCPYCNKMVDIGNGKRWHFDNCKNKKST